uniref:ADF-H domain-containing protein n=1 Tax=Prymnesium polylepis TaxID=72548 RepID=A0A7S4HCW9_9EUKA|mmetsp:Transcript_11308/g.28225  ORF Transcript_11308/g.28225 Transcript_11308/m.28225 type:complete len:161 (+) Transcript_11308:175-657(+)
MDGEAGAKVLNAGRMNASASAVDMSDPEIAAAWAECVGSAPQVGAWIALGYEGKAKLKRLASGTDGYRGLRAHLAEDAVVYGAFRVTTAGESTASKFTFVTSIGENAGGMVKGRATAHAQCVEAGLEGTAGGIQLAGEEEKEPEAVAAKLSKMYGAKVSL